MDGYVVGFMFVFPSSLFNLLLYLKKHTDKPKAGTIHLLFEGYFSLNHLHMGGQQDIIGQLWKEYALSDSRYLTGDTFVVCMESMTAVSPSSPLSPSSPTKFFNNSSFSARSVFSQLSFWSRRIN